MTDQICVKLLTVRKRELEWLDDVEMKEMAVLPSPEQELRLIDVDECTWQHREH